MKFCYYIFVAILLHFGSSAAAEMPPAWPWHGVSIQNTEPFDPAQLEQIVKAIRINSIQIRLMPRQLAAANKLSSEQAWSSSLSWGDKMLDECKRLGLVAVMTVEGGYPFDPAKPLLSNSKEFWDDANRLDEAVRTVDNLSAFYAKRGNELVGYQILSEPLFYEENKGVSPPQWRSFMEKVIATIRSHDANRWIAVAPPPGGSPNIYTGFEPFNSARIIYGAHMYIPQAFTHQGILSWSDDVHTYPGRIGLQYWDKQVLIKIMSPLRDFQQRYQVPVWIGEFSAIAWAKGGDQYLLDLVDIFNEWNWSWTYFSLNGYFGWSPDYDDIKPEPMNTWPKHQVGGTSVRWQVLKKATGG